jgi:hypothetical protein
MVATARSFWRQPVAWLFVALPLLTLAAAFVTIRIAARDTVDAARGDTRWIAQVQIEDLGADREAARRGMKATLIVSPERGDVVLTLAAAPDDLAGLQLMLLHPARAAQDRSLRMRRDGAQWRGQTLPWPAGQSWDVELADTDRHWRLKGRIGQDAREAVLNPAVAF